MAANILRPSCVKVIRFIARNGEATQYEICRGTPKLSYASVHEAVKELVAYGLIEEVKDARREKGPGPLPKRYFTLTLRGLCVGLAIWLGEEDEKEAASWGSIDSTLEKWEELEPLIFGKWRHIIAGVGRDEAIRKLRGAATPATTPGGFDLEDLRYDFFECLFEERYPGETPETLETWIKTIASDVELRNHAGKWVKNKLKAVRRMQKWYDRILQGIRG